MALVVADAFLVAVAMMGSLWIQAGRAIAPLFPGMWGEPTQPHACSGNEHSLIYLPLTLPSPSPFLPRFFNPSIYRITLTIPIRLVQQNVEAHQTLFARGRTCIDSTHTISTSDIMDAGPEPSQSRYHSRGAWCAL